MKYRASKINIKNETEGVTAFRGIKQGKNGLKDMLNLKCGADGSMTVRAKRGYIRPFSSGNGLFADDTLAYVDSQKLYYGGQEVSGIALTPGEKTILKIGSFLMVFPDKVYVNLDDPTRYGAMSLSLDIANTRVYPVSSSKVEIKCTEVTELPDEPTNGAYFAIRQSDGSVVLKRYLNKAWQICKPLVKIDSSLFGTLFNVGDTVVIDSLKNYIGESAKILYRDSGSIIVEGFIESSTMFYNVTLKRIVPDFDYVTVSGNRLCGVRRGKDHNGEYVCKMYASAIGEPFNFCADKGAVEASVEISGAFTGICDYLGLPVAFGENEIIETRIKNGSLLFTTVKSYGVERGAHNSIASANGVVYYKSKDGICRYDGSYPERILPLEESVWAENVSSPAIYVNGKYYIKITDNNSKSAIYIYDEELETWTKENDPGIKSFACRGRSIYAQYESGGNQGLMLLNYGLSNESERGYCSDEGYPIPEGDVAWSFESAEIGTDSFSGVCPVRAVIRMKKPEGVRVSVGVIYDGVKDERETTVDGETVGAITVPVPLRRCDTFRLTVRGVGQCTLLGYAVEMRQGGVSRAWR